MAVSSALLATRLDLSEYRPLLELARAQIYADIGVVIDNSRAANQLLDKRARKAAKDAHKNQ